MKGVRNLEKQFALVLDVVVALTASVLLRVYEDIVATG